jgi:hypothetical protein
MESGADSTPAFSHMRPITLKSERRNKSTSSQQLTSCSGTRVLLSTVRNNGNCPCPRCLVAKTDIHKMGQSLDLRGQLSKARNYAHDLIKQARLFIYNLGLNVAGAAVERLLSEWSWVPTFVRPVLVILVRRAHDSIRTRLL